MGWESQSLYRATRQGVGLPCSALRRLPPDANISLDQHRKDLLPNVTETKSCIPANPYTGKSSTYTREDSVTLLCIRGLLQCTFPAVDGR